jgi:hypothetical protein
MKMHDIRGSGVRSRLNVYNAPLQVELALTPSPIGREEGSP